MDNAFCCAISIIFLFIPWVLSQENCRNLEFREIAQNKALANHTIRTVRPISDFDACIQECYMDLRCFTVNLCTKTDGSMTCNLLDSDHVRSKDNLIDKRGCIHYGSKSACSSSPCPKAATCQGDFVKAPVFRCICPAGYTGQACDILINTDICSTGAHGCHANAECASTADGKYSCQCKDGFFEDGKNCQDLDECSWKASASVCHVNATCQNTDGSYLCTCNAGYLGDGKHCKAAETCEELKSSLNSSELLSDIRLFPLPLNSTMQYSIFCTFSRFPCGEGTWRLAMKIDGRKKTFKYFEQKLWESKEAYNAESGKTGLDDEETKTSAFWDTPLNKLCLGMKYNGKTRWIRMGVNGSSLYDVMNGDERITRPKIDRKDKWKSLLSGSEINENDCLKEGFNLDAKWGNSKTGLRLGILGTNKTACNEYDSFIGVGPIVNNAICGNYLHVPPKAIEAFCYILVN